MALDPATLKAEIFAQMTAQGLAPSNPEAGGIPDQLWLAVATAIVNHLKADAEVPVTGGSSAGVYKVQ